MASWQDMPRYRRGPPAVVFFHGFQANTATLEAAGWRIAEHVEMDIAWHRERIQLVLKEPQGRFKIRGIATIDSDLHVPHERMQNYPIVIHANDVFHEMMHTVHPRHGMQHYREIDMSHTIMDHMVSIQWGSVFPPRSESKEDLFLGKADMGVIEHLDAIKRLQAPKQKELRAKAMREPQQTVARLIQVA